MEIAKTIGMTMTRLVMKRAIDGVTDGDTRWAIRAG